jgi:hypothetical protein
VAEKGAEKTRRGRERVVLENEIGRREYELSVKYQHFEEGNPEPLKSKDF